MGFRSKGDKFVKVINPRKIYGITTESFEYDNDVIIKSIAKMGRPPIMPELREIVREIGPTRLQSLPSMQRIVLIQRAFIAKYNVKEPALNTVRKALRAEGYRTGLTQKVQKF